MSMGWILFAAALPLYRLLRPGRTVAAPSATPAENAPDPIERRVEAGQHA